MPCVESPSSEFGEQNFENVLMTPNDNSENSLLNSANNPKDNRCGGRCELAHAGTARKLTDPFDFHVYVGFSPKNYAVIKRIIDTLKTTRNLLSCHRQDAGTTKEKEERKHLIERSEKCLLYVTLEYLQESWAKAEVTAAVKKARRFSRGMLFVLKDPQISAESLKDLQAFSMSDWPPVAVDDDADTLPAELASWLLQDVELAPISQMPEKISGYYVALVYYFGYLNLVLDGHRQKMKHIFDSGEKVVLPMLVIVPESCNAPKSFHVEDKILTCTNRHVMSPSHHGGSKNRAYRIPVMKLIVDAEKNDVIYFSGEFPTCLLTVYETSGQAGITEYQLNEIRNDFCSTLQSLLCHPHSKHCVDQYRLLLWPDDSVELYEFLLRIVPQLAEEGDASSLVCGPRGGGSQLLDSSFSRVQPVVSPTRLWDGSQPYAMRDDIRPRGICLIIDISDTTSTSTVDVPLLRQLFSGQFDFKVLVHSGQMRSDQLDSLLGDVAQKDHSRYDAFVCYIASRGRLGTVFTYDGMCTAFNLVHTFSHENSEKLRGKPKLFLMQITDDGATDDSVFDDNETRVQFSVHRVFSRI